MVVRVEIQEGALGPAGGTGATSGVGAVLQFEGLVRSEEDGRAIAALRYEAYEPMAQRMLERIGGEVARQYGLERLEVWHSKGVVPVGGCSLRVRIESPHRLAGLDAMARFIDQLKQDVPIWKHVVERV